MFNFYRYQNAESKSVEEQDKDRKKKFRILKKKEQEQFFLENYQKRVLHFLSKMKEKPIKIEDIYEIRKKIRNCDRDYNPFSKEQFRETQRKWLNFSASKQASNLQENLPQNKSYSVPNKKNMGSTTYKYSVMDDTNYVVNLDQFIPSKINQNDNSVLRSSLTIDTQTRSKTKKIKKGDLNLSKQMNFTGSKNDIDPREEVMERFQIFKGKLGQVKIRQSQVLNDNQFDLENFLSKNVEFKISQARKQSYEQQDSDRDTIDQELNSVQLIDDKNRIALPRVNQFNIKKKQINNQNNTKNSNEQLQNNKLYFTAVKSLLMDRNMPINRKGNLQSQSVSFSDVWRMFIETKTTFQILLKFKKKQEKFQKNVKYKKDQEVNQLINERDTKTNF